MRTYNTIPVYIKPEPKYLPQPWPLDVRIASWLFVVVTMAVTFAH